MPINIKPMERRKISPGIVQSSNSKTSAVATSSTQSVRAKNKLTLKTLEGHEPFMSMQSRMQPKQILSISYLPDGKRMISASYDKTTRQWDLRAGKEIEEFQARDVETRIVKTFEGHFNWIHPIDVSADSTLLAGGSWDDVRIWSMETGKLMAGPFRVQGGAELGVLRFSQDSKKLAVLSAAGRCLEVWDVQTQKLDVRVEESRYGSGIQTPIFWTTKDKSIVAAFDFKDKPKESWELELGSGSDWQSSESEVEVKQSESDYQPLDYRDLNTVYEFNASTLQTVGAPFEGHTHIVTGLALTFDCALLASASRYDHTIKLWAFESRQLLASFDNQYPDLLTFSPNSHQLAYTNLGDTKIYIYDPPLDILATIRLAQQACIPRHTSTCSCTNVLLQTRKQSDLLNSNATPRIVRRKPAIFIAHARRPLLPLPTIRPRYPAFLGYLRKLLPSSSTSAVPPVRNDQPHDPWDFPATSPLPPNRSPYARTLTQGSSHINFRENPRPTPAPPTTLSPASASKARLSSLFTWWPVRAGHTSPPTVHVPLAWGELRHAAAGAPSNDDDWIRDEDVPSPPSPNPNSRPLAAQINTGQRGKVKVSRRRDELDIFKMPVNVKPMEHQRISPGIVQSSNSKASAMASSSTQPVGAKNKLNLKPVMILEGHGPLRNMFSKQYKYVSFISYLPDGKRMISASSEDKTTRQWDLQAGKEIEEVRDVCEQETRKMALSGDGRWVVTSTYIWGKDHSIGKLQARDVETRIVKTFEGCSNFINCTDVSADSTLLADGSRDGVRMWSMETGKLVAGPFRLRVQCGAEAGVLRFSRDSKKLAVLSFAGRCLEVWDVQTQKLDVRVEKSRYGTCTDTPIFWTTKDKSIVSTFDFKDDPRESRELERESLEVTSQLEVSAQSELELESPASESRSALDGSNYKWLPHPDVNTIYEFDALTLETVGAPFEGHTQIVTGLALSFDCAILASASRWDHTIKLWAFESRQLLASFDDQHIDLLIFSPTSHQLSYNQLGSAQEAQLNTKKKSDLLNSNATRRAARRNPATIPVRHSLRPPPTIHPEQRTLIRYLRKLLPFRTHVGLPVPNDVPRDPLDFSATSPLPSNRSPQATTQTRSYKNRRPTSAPPTTLSSAPASQARPHRLFTWWPIHATHSPHIVDTPLAWGKERYATAGAPPKDDDDIIRDEDVPSPPPSPNPNSQPLATRQTNAGEHGSGRLCGCF
ncbi:hypothetical protein EDB19DRAFT_1901571 [Suillus lakei]|nr:hypothetical protein EDB19DRAFT_1901571 [Suillus lakei]